MHQRKNSCKENTIPAIFEDYQCIHPNSKPVKQVAHSIQVLQSEPITQSASFKRYATILAFIAQPGSTAVHLSPSLLSVYTADVSQARSDESAIWILYGNMACCRRPVVSGSPMRRFKFCKAWPEAPFTKLSRTARKKQVSTWISPKPPFGAITPYATSKAFKFFLHGRSRLHVWQCEVLYLWWQPKQGGCANSYRSARQGLPEMMIALPDNRSSKTATRLKLLPLTWRVWGIWPFASTCTNGSSL